MSFWKDKTIIAYIALPHHTRFITPVMEKIAALGADIKYVVGQAERSQEITALELGLDYCHIFDFISKEDTEIIHRNYQLLLKTFTPALKHQFLFSASPATVIDKTIYAAAVEYVGVRNLLRTLQPNLCFALHELNRWGKMLGFWSKMMGIPFITLQEGLTYNLDFGYTGHAQYSTLNLVWGERVRRKFASFEAPSEKIVPVGNTHLAKEIQRQKKYNKREKIRKKYHIENEMTGLVIFSSKPAPPDNLLPLFKEVSKNKRLRLFVKFHPATKQQEIDRFIESLPEIAQTHTFFIHGQEDTYDLISASDVCILTQPSTTGLEALALGKPLVKMDFGHTPGASFSFVDQKVAVKMTVEELSEAMAEEKDFSRLIDKDNIKKFLENELKDTASAVVNTCTILQEVINSSLKDTIQPIQTETINDMKWSIILIPPENPDQFLFQLNAVSANSNTTEDFETIIITSQKITNEHMRIIDSLRGDVKHVAISDTKPFIEGVNRAAKEARGQYLSFLPGNLAPLPQWLSNLDKGFSAHGTRNIFGARIADNNDQVVHSGMVVGRNNTPVHPYAHLDIHFEPVLKERRFQLIDLFCALPKDLFLEIGGFTPKAGRHMIKDLCLKTGRYLQRIDPAIYLPDVKLMLLEKNNDKDSMEDSIYFFSKWHSDLWESESKLFESDDITKQRMDAEKIAAASKTI